VHNNNANEDGIVNRKINDWVGNIIAFIIVIAVNMMANALPIGGQTTGEIAAKYASPFMPAGYTFSIWGIIYLGLSAFVIYQALPGQRHNDLLAKIHKAFVINCMANAAWIFVWHFDLLWLSLLVMVIILGTLVKIYRLLGIADRPMTRGQFWFVNLPFSLYLGWITVATLANISVVQTAMAWDHFGIQAVNWTLIKLAITGAIGAAVVLLRGDIIFVLPIVWAALGIAVNQIALPAVWGAAKVLTVLFVLLIIFETIRKLRGFLLQSKVKPRDEKRSSRIRFSLDMP
jgi:hypothetical protein